METAIKPLLLVFAVLYISLVFVWRTLTVWRKTKKFPITYGKSDSAHDYLGQMFKGLILLYVVSTTVFIASEALYHYFIPLKSLETMPVKVAGLAIAYLSMLWTIIAQAQMGDSWRIGIDTELRTEVVRKGLFRFSRNPIYLSVMTTAFALFLIMPNVLNLIIFLMIVLTLTVQARLEEEYLSQAFGDTYLEYKSNTRRWL